MYACKCSSDRDEYDDTRCRNSTHAHTTPLSAMPREGKEVRKEVVEASDEGKEYGGSRCCLVLTSKRYGDGLDIRGTSLGLD